MGWFDRVPGPLYDAAMDPRDVKPCWFFAETLVLAAVFSAARWVLNRTLFAWLAASWLPAAVATRPRHVNKWNESCWRLFCYSLSCVVGFYIAAGEPWLRNVDATWTDHSRYEYSETGRWYMLSCLGFYVHLLVMQFVEERKKDFVAMIIHHVATLLLIGLSYYYYFLPMAVLIVLLHDVSDPFMELAKLCKYAKFARSADVLFIIFAVVFGVSRLWYFPFIVIDSTYRMSVPLYPLAYEGLALLCTLLVLHAYWFSIIISMAVKFALAGTVRADGRSESDTDDDKRD